MADTLGQFFKSVDWHSDKVMNVPPEPYTPGIDTNFHSDDPAVLAAMSGNSGGFIQDITSLHMGFNSSVMVPGIGMVPFNLSFVHQGGNIGVAAGVGLEAAVKHRVEQLKVVAKEAIVREADSRLRSVNLWMRTQAELGVSAELDEISDLANDILVEPERGPFEPRGVVAKNIEELRATMVAAQMRNKAFNTYTKEKPAGENSIQNEDLEYLNNPNNAEAIDSRQRTQLLSNLFASSMGMEQRPKVLQEMTDKLAPILHKNRPFLTTVKSTDAEHGYFEVSARADLPIRSDRPDDDDAYVPLVFTDMRPIRSGKYRAVYFKPYIKSISEQFSPSWNMQNFWGRVDKVATYQATDRSISLAFKVVTEDPRELKLNYQKLNWLKSMVYPMYKSNVIHSGPVIGLRIGDVVNAGGFGVTGVITSLGVDYSEATWELAKERKLPREFDVNISFQVLHDSPIGLSNSRLKFGGVAGDRADIKRFHNAFGEDFLNKKE